MHIEVQLTEQAIPEKITLTEAGGVAGAWVEFRGVVRGEEAGVTIAALEYEAYPEMALREMRRLLEELATTHACLAANVIHRVGVIPVGEAAIFVGIAGKHRAEAFALMSAFMDRLKQDVPVWKTGSAKVCGEVGRVTPRAPSGGGQRTARPATLSLDDARDEIAAHCQSLPGVRVPLVESVGRVLRETVCALEDLPAADKSTRDGYAIRADDNADLIAVVDTLHAADWKPRELKPGEAVRVATGASLPCGGLRVVMQEHVEREGDRIRIVRREDGTNIRQRGEDVRAGAALVTAGTRLAGGSMALVATAGCAMPLVSPRLRVLHFTTGDEIVPPGATPQPGQIRDSNSFLIRGLLHAWPGDLEHAHLPENFAAAQSQIANCKLQIDAADVLLISGGASVGDKDFTRPLLESLGYEIVLAQVNLRPGKPLIFGVKGSQIAFGLPGNPLSHFVCFHAFVTVALARLTGQAVPGFKQAALAEILADARCGRETLWPAQYEWSGNGAGIRPLAWASSGDVTCLARANALIRVPVNCDPLPAGEVVEFLPAGC